MSPAKNRSVPSPATPIPQPSVTATAPSGSTVDASRMPLRYRRHELPSKAPARCTQLPTSPAGMGAPA